MTTQFGDKYRAWARITKATMRIHHKPGDAMQVDWAGDTLSVYDSMTGDPHICLSPFCRAAVTSMRKPLQT